MVTKILIYYLSGVFWLDLIPCVFSSSEDVHYPPTPLSRSSAGQREIFSAVVSGGEMFSVVGGAVEIFSVTNQVIHALSLLIYLRHGGSTDLDVLFEHGVFRLDRFACAPVRTCLASNETYVGRVAT
jgi:hypothetical protein